MSLEKMYRRKRGDRWGFEGQRVAHAGQPAPPPRETIEQDEGLQDVQR